MPRAGGDIGDAGGLGWIPQPSNTPAGGLIQRNREVWPLTRLGSFVLKKGNLLAPVSVCILLPTTRF